ncbi:hypothetical protein AB9P05_21355 [Roseivirga sp. BDSF3-8]|uniref:hypothetical protein n=1 Tax=Roseivirga sp. BDSF3-8 TaxID=3241598 RepID=UPI0035321D15
MRIGILACFIFCLVYDGQAQQKADSVSYDAHIRVIARNETDQIILRWAPTAPIAWKTANEYGYVIERFTISKNGIVDSLSPERQLLTPEPIKPWPQAKWEGLATTENKMAAIALQALHGNNVEVTVRESTGGGMGMLMQSEQEQMRYSFALLAADVDAEVSRALGLRFEDRSIKIGEIYVYRISLAKQREGYHVRSGAVRTDPMQLSTLPVLQQVKADFGDLTAKLSWDVQFMERFYSGYKIERSANKGKTFEAVNEEVFTGTYNEERPGTLYYTDSLPENGKTYQYRIRGVSPFGITGPASEVVSGEGMPAISAGQPVITEVLVDDNKRNEIQWRYPEDLQPALRGFKIAVAPTAQGPFTLLQEVRPGQRTFRHKDPATVSYYSITAVGENGEEVSSFPYLVQSEDSTPPAVPAGLTGTVSTDGVVALQWQANTEADLEGYILFRANSAAEQFYAIHRDPISGTSFRDSININTLTEKVYYKLVAMDKRYNKSAYSPALELNRPDLIAPSAPVLTRVENTDEGLLLTWVPSSSLDVTGYNLMRHSGGRQEVIGTISPEATTFLDKAVKTGVAYRYELTAADDAGLSSPPSSREITRLPVETSGAGLSWATITANPGAGGITLTWEAGDEQPEQVIVYRQLGDGPLRQYTILNGDKSTYTDQLVNATETYTYRLQWVGANGIKKKLSEPKTVNY